MASKLVLGTVQLGMPYGINNTHGQPGKDEAFAILDFAWKSGIDTLDTAPAYGNAEELLGTWLRSRSHIGSTNIISKAGRYGEDLDDQVRHSLRLLGLEQLYGVLLHSSASMRDKTILNSLFKLKQGGLCANVGTITYTPGEAIEALEIGFDMIQVPYNVFDRRLDKCNFFQEAARRSVTVFARSPSLQGLLLMSPERIPDALAHARPHVEKFRDIAASHGLLPIEAAFMFVLAHRHIDHVVFGVERKSQLEQVISVVQKNSSASCITELSRAFDEMETTIIDPTLWQTAK